MSKAIREIRIEGNVAYVPLTKGYEAVIDAADVPLVEGFNWCAAVDGRSVYAIRTGPRPERKSILLHRVLMGDSVGMEVDHQDGDGLNNQRGNLRVATKSQNMHNQRTRVDNASGMKGVHWSNVRGKWVAEISLNGRRSHLGYFTTPEAAHAAYVAASERLHGDFGRVA